MFNPFKKNKEKEEKDSEVFWEMHKQAIAKAKIEAKERDEAFFKKFCPMVNGPCRQDCVNFSHAWGI